MATTVTVKPLAFEDPAWAVAQAKPGEDVGLSVTARNLEAGLEVWFEISGPGGKIDVVKGKVEGEQGKATWKAPNPAGTAQFKFDAVLRQIPTPANGHLTVRRRLTSGQLTVQGYRASLGATDAAFVPKQEKLSAKVSVTDAGGAAKAGRYEIWGERYPSDKPLYTEDFTPAAGDTTWNTWDGKANDGVLNGKYISPEFSPYRLRVIIGPDADAVKDPHGKGKGRVSIAETQFEVAFQSLRVRLQDGLEAAVQTALASALAIEPRQPNGTFAATGRLPAETEQGRIRLPSVRYNVIGESLNQGVTDLTPPPAPASTWQHRVQDPYMDGGGQTKFLGLSSCNSMRWSKTGKWFNPAKGGVHSVNGFHGLMYIGGGYIEKNRESYVIRGEAQYRNPSDFWVNLELGNALERAGRGRAGGCAG